MDDYIATLEAQNEELKKMLAEAQSKKPEWVRVDAPEDCVMWQYKLGNSLYGYYEYNEMVPTHITGVTGFAKFSDCTEKEVRKAIEQDFGHVFLRYAE